MLFKLLLLLSLCLSPLSAQIDIFPPTGGGSADTHTESTVAGLPGAPASGTVRIVTDGNAAGDCTTGGGSNRVLCEYTGSGWAPLGDGNSGGAPAFSSVTTGTNTGATMTVGTGATITISGTGVNNANQYKGNSVVAEADIHADIARDSEVTSEIATHAAIADAHHTATVQRTQEEIEDFVGAFIADGTGTYTGISIVYGAGQDATDDVDITIDHDAAANFVADEHVAHSGITITAGAGLGGGGTIDGNVTVTSASGETDFLANGALTCGAGTQGRAQVHTTPLQYCDNAATPVLQYAAYGDSAGNAAGVQANSVALGTDTTGNYAGSSSEGGAATTALALDANPAALTAGNYCSDLNADGTCAAETDATTEINSAISTHAGDAVAHHADSILESELTNEATLETQLGGINVLVNTELNTFALLDALVADKSLINTADAATLLLKTLTGPIIGPSTVAGLPAAGTANRVYIVTDGNAAGDCTTGGGSSVVLCRDTGAAWAALGDGNSGGAPGFDAITGGTNTSAAMVVGTGASLAASGSGTITATGVAANSVALTTDTTGNYVASITNGTGITGGDGGSEGAALTPAFDFSDVGANWAGGSDEGRFTNEGVSDGGMVFEGATADTIETKFIITDPTSTDKNITFPDASGEVSLLGQSIDLASEVTGVAPDANVANDITLDNITQITTRAISDTTGDLAASRVDDGGVAATQALFSGAGAAAGFRAIADADVPDTITIDLATTATTANNLAADGLDAMTEIATGIKRRADDVDTHLLTTSAAIPGANRCLELDTNGSVVAAADTCANLGPGGTPTMDVIGDPAAAVTQVSGAVGETFDFDFQAAYTTGNLFTIRGTTGNPSGGTLLNVQTHDAQLAIANLWDGTNGVQVSAAGAMAAVGTGTITATGVTAGAVTRDGVEAELRTHVQSFSIDPTVAATGEAQFRWGYPITLTEIRCDTDAGTVASVNVEERAPTTPNTAGTAALTAALLCDTNSETGTGFTNADIDAWDPVALVYGTVTTATILRVYVEFTID